jgi:hypothetical protein
MLTIDVTRADGLEKKVYGFKTATREGFVLAVKLWHQNMLPRHFKGGAEARYGLAPRSEKYQQRKARVKHHTQPLVYSGRMRDRLTAPFNFKVVFSQGSARGTFITGSDVKYFYMYRPGGIRKTDEIKAVSADEVATFETFLLNYITDKVNQRLGSGIVAVQ